MFCEWNVYRKSIVTLALSPYRQSTVLAPQPYHFRRRLVVYALTLPSLPQFLSSFVCSSVWWHWTKPGSFPPSLCALSTSALSSILFILLHYPIWSIRTTLTFSALLKLGSNPLPPLLNFWTAHLHSTHWSELPVMAPTRSRPLAVAQLSWSVNLSRNYPLLYQIFHRSFIFCHSATFSFEVISLQYLSSSIFVDSF